MPLAPDPVPLFGIPLAFLGLSIICKYIIELPEFQNNRFPRSKHFAVLRFGPDLATLGFAAVVALVTSGYSVKQPRNSCSVWLVEHQDMALVLEVLLPLLTLLVTAMLRSPERRFLRGTLVPGLLGLLAIALSIEMALGF